MYMDKLIDWKDFELFIQQMYKTDPNLIVEHDVTLIGKSGAKRQIDVLITQKTKLHTYKTIVECKKWKEKVSRNIVDIVWAGMEDLNASKGVIFTTSGYEEGAQKYAESKNIDIFLIRELLPEEWGAPGRQIHFYLHVLGGEFKNINVKANALLVVEEPPISLDINITFEKDKELDEAYTLYSIRNGKPGPNLVKILEDKHNSILQAMANKVSLIEDGKKDVDVYITSEVELDMTSSEFRQLRRAFGAVNLEKINFVFTTHISQSEFSFDKGAAFNIALAAENYIQGQKYLVSQRKNNLDIEIVDAPAETPDDKDILTNDSIFNVICKPYVEIKKPTGTERNGKTEKIYMTL